MNEAMVLEWNEIVSPEDTVYILGDVAFLPAAKAVSYMNRLNGSKILVEGNHDRKLLNDPVFRRCFTEVHKYLWMSYEGTQVIMFHYPIAEWDQMHRGAVHFHGHLHGGKSGLEDFRALDVGMDSTGCIVIQLEDAIARAMKGQIKGHHV
jgi:calcineurin-like phosphoesterase family protein